MHHSDVDTGSALFFFSSFFSPSPLGLAARGKAEAHPVQLLLSHALGLRLTAAAGAAPVPLQLGGAKAEPKRLPPEDDHWGASRSQGLRGWQAR